MSALNPLRLKGEPFGANVPAAGDYTMQNNTSPPPSIITVSPPPQYRFPDVPPPTLPSPSSASSPSASSPSNSPSTSTSSNSSSISLRPLIFSPQPVPARPASPLLSLSDFYLPALTPDEILDTLDHLASSAPKKKSHARKQPAGHIPRPRNAFILFRCLFVSQQAVPASVEKDHRNISRIAGKVWKSMSNEQRDPWVKASELEKTRHEARFPNYRYNPVQPQVLPKRFAFKAPADKPVVLRVHPKHEDDDHPFPRLHDDRDVSHGVHAAGYYAPPQFTIPFADYSEMSLPPDSPPPTPSHFRLATRRSSSCPPLPPLTPAFPFNNPNPWLAPSYTSPFAYSFPPPPPPSFPPAQPPAQPQDRPLTAPEHDFLPPAARFTNIMDTRLAHRRGSSLDRAIASSSIAGAFGGGGLPRHCWTPSDAAAFSFSRRPSQAHPPPQHSGEATPTEFTSSSDDAGDTPPALSPQSSFERGRSALPRALLREDSDDVMVHDSSSSPPHYHTRELFHPHRRRSPPPPTKIPARLFGSQGARLGLDLDLDDVPLALDVSFHSQHHDSPSPNTGTSSESGSSFPPYTPPFSYTQALLSMDTDGC